MGYWGTPTEYLSPGPKNTRITVVKHWCLGQLRGLDTVVIVVEWDIRSTSKAYSIIRCRTTRHRESTSYKNCFTTSRRKWCRCAKRTTIQLSLQPGSHGTKRIIISWQTFHQREQRIWPPSYNTKVKLYTAPSRSVHTFAGPLLFFSERMQCLLRRLHSSQGVSPSQPLFMRTQ